MYEAFYGLREKPFELHPDPDYVYMSPKHEEVYTHLRYAMRECKGFVVITGEIGSGKTTLLNLLLRGIPEGVDAAFISNTCVPPVQFLKLVCKEFGISADRMEKPAVISALRNALLERRNANRRVVLIADEAQNLPARTLEEIRMLSNLESGKQHLLQILLVGQPELREKLNQRGLEQLLQRVTVHCHLGGLGQGEVKRYIQHRLQVAGANDSDIFDESAVEAVYRHSGGIPRVVNILCDTALVYGYGEEKKKIDRWLVESVMQARREGGLFPSAKQTEDPTPDLGSLIGEPIAELQDRISVLEERVLGLETSFALARSQSERSNQTASVMVKWLKVLKQRVENLESAAASDQERTNAAPERSALTRGVRLLFSRQASR